MSDPKSFIILNAIIVTLLVAYFLTLKKKERPTKLNFKAPDTPLAPVIPPAASAIPLNIIFNYNGHSFDAYEVLGVPAGSNLQEIQAAFEKSVGATTDVSSHQFYKTAYEAIQKAANRS